MDVYQRRRLVAGLAIVLVLVLVVVAVAGGGDDEEAPITTVTGATSGGLEPLSKDEFIEQADDICEETAVAIANLTGNDTEELAQDELEFTESELDQLRTLAPPEEDQARLDDFFAALEDLVDVLEKQDLAAERGDEDALAEAATEIDTARAEVLEAAEDYGFRECGEAGEPTSSDTGDTGAVPPATGGTPVVPATPPPATTPPAAPPPADGDDDGGGSGGVGPG